MCLNILIINCHWDNRGDEAAIRAMIDEIATIYPEAHFFIQRASGVFKSFPLRKNMRLVPAFPGRYKQLPFDILASLTNGKVCLLKNEKIFYKILQTADIVIHAPGGPSIGDIYLRQERKKLWRLMLVRQSGVPYVFYAPSMGPFHNRFRNIFRRKVLKDSSLICLREELSQKMVKEFIPEANPIVTLDSAFQHDINLKTNQKLLERYTDLSDFITSDKVIGITITDLQWNSLYKGKVEIAEQIRNVFTVFIEGVIKEGYRVLLIPQLFESSNDYDYMKSYAVNKNIFVMSDEYDCYFQQYIISKLKAVIGMRYHSNIFSAKMGTPFISISYEQKMLGFMQKAGLMDYCIDINELSIDRLNERFRHLIDNYEIYRNLLDNKKKEFKRQSHMTTELVVNILDKENL